jgi:beta-lactamase regulating signal transducer with metallopeptidase domain
MPDAITQLSETLIRVLGHSLWQAALISAAVWFLLRTLPAKHAERRYAIALGGLASIVAAALVTWSVLRLEPTESISTAIQKNRPMEQTVRSSDSPSASRQSSPAEPQAEVAELAEHTDQNPTSFAADATSSINRSGPIVARWLSVIWLCGAVVMLLRGLTGFVIARRWLVESAAAAESGLQELKDIVKELSQRLKLRRLIRIVLSDRIDTPAVVGVLWPVIMVPVSMLTGVPADQWRIMIAHELAHIRRWDPLVSLIQMVVESLLFFNPFVWWLNRITRAEREACCDAVAARICGQPMSVAKTLVDVAASIHRPLISSVMAFAEPSSEGELSDRVLRLVQPDRAPQSKISWLSVTVVMVALAATFILLQRGTDIAVQTAANWMSPKERVEKLVQLEAERNGNFVPATVLPDGSGNSQDPNAGKIAVHLIVKTEDGSKITPKLSLHSMTRTANSSTGSSMSGPNSEEDEYRKTHYFSPCQLQIGGSHPDFAAVSSPIITLMPDDKEKTIELILTRGSTVNGLVANEQGEPVPQATVKYSAGLGFRGSWSGSSAQETQTDEAGQFQFSHIANSEYLIEVMAKGYQRLRQKESLGKSVIANSPEPFKMVLKAARPVSVRVVDKQSNQPITNARLRITYRQSGTEGMSYGFSRRWANPDQWQDYAISNSDGLAVIDQLEDNAAYTFAVVAETYGVGVLEIKADDAEATISLSPSIKISGRMTGNLQTLQKSTDVTKPGFQVGVNSRLGSTARGFDDSYMINIDPEGHFEIDRLTEGGQLMLFLPNERRELHITESMTELEIPILPKEPEPDMPVREVVIRLTGTDPEAPAQGTLSIYWNHPTARMEDRANNHNMPITSNEVRLKIPVGAFLNFRQESLAGYRIEEQNQVEILPGTAPQVIEAKVMAVGGIYGSIKRADGSAADRASTHVLAIELPPGETNSSKINSSYSRSGFLFMKSVPFGGRYRLLTHEQTDDTCVWTVSDEFTIDESDPIVKMDIVLPSGRDLTLRLVDANGKPVAAQDVKLNCSFSQKAGGIFSRKSRRDFGSYGFSSNTTTDSNGICVFRGVSLDEPLEGIELKLTATIEPGPYRGKTQTIETIEFNKTNQPVEIMLSRGLTVSGYLIDVATNKPIPSAELRLSPRHFDRSEFHGLANTKTDSTGRFEFSGLEPIEYTGYVNDASPKGAVLQPQGGGGLRISYPAGVEQLSLTATDPPGEPVRWEVIIHPNSPLRPLD